jgi:hypothetical protein
MNLTHELENFLEFLLQTSLQHKAVKEAFKRELQYFDKMATNSGGNTEICFHSLIFKDPILGKTVKLKTKRTTIEERIKILWVHNNNQYCWLLVDCYEKFKAFIKTTYRIDKGVEKVHDKVTLQKMLSYFSEKYPHFKRSESKNAIGIHLRIAVILIEKIRHAIVHKRGFVDSDKFPNIVINEAAINNDRISHEEFILQFIFDNHVKLLELPISNHNGLFVYHDVFTHLMGYLISYAMLISDVLNKSNVDNRITTACN